MTELTWVTGVFDLDRGHKTGSLGEIYIRPFQFYLDRLIELLQVDIPMSIYLEPDYEPIIWEHRRPHNTRVFTRTVETFRTEFPFFDQVQAIRNDPAWRKQAGWLEESPQANLALYNPMVMSKMFMLHDQCLINPFNSEHFVWVDGAITHTVNPGYLVEGHLIDKLEPLLRRFLFLCFPYRDGTEIHGFERAAMHRFAKTSHVAWVARGGLFGGHADYIKLANAFYYRLLDETLNQGYMGTEESIFTLMTYLEPHRYDRFMLNQDGLIVTFLQRLKEGTVRLETSDSVCHQESLETVTTPRSRTDRQTKKPRTALYVISFNAPDQLRLSLESWSKQPGFISQTENYLIDNSSDNATYPGYEELCKEYGFAHIKMDNLGINGGRQHAAELFANSGCDYSIYLEDDFSLNDEVTGYCRNGLPGCVTDLYRKVHAIMKVEDFDILKFSFTEFYGSNDDQWAWYNVPQRERQEIWPEMPDLPEQGFAERLPKTKLDYVGSISGLSYAAGEIYYSNWPQIVSQRGNQTMFLETKWAHPHEQTWMSHLFQLTRQKRLRPAVLLASPIQHHRIYQYDPSLRKES